MKNRKNFNYKNPAATPTFCKRNLSQMYYVDFIHTLLSVHILCFKPWLVASSVDQAKDSSRYGRNTHADFC